MDIFSHGLWAGAAAQAINTGEKAQRFTKRRVSGRWAFFWGIFPDLFAFTIPFVWMVGQIAIGNGVWEGFHPPHEPVQGNSIPFLALTSLLYNFSHSIPIFLLLFTLAYVILKRPLWEMSGILVHIISDIPTHSYAFFPTPFLWPLSDFKVNGISWGTPWFMVLNYSAIILIYTLLHRKNRTPLVKT
ncbi:MAG: hypothetical protein Q7S11_00680 [bacterium]|nr:hypothetical protein [bacterium]